MQHDRALVALHAGAVVAALTAALVWPRAGQPALLVPLTGGGLDAALHWAAREDAELLELDTASGRIVARMAPGRSAASAIASGLVPVATGARGCATAKES